MWGLQEAQHCSPAVLVDMYTAPSAGDGGARRGSAGASVSTARERAGVDAECLSIVSLYVDVDGVRHVRVRVHGRVARESVGDHAAR